jgi:hypothetical protein
VKNPIHALHGLGYFAVVAELAHNMFDIGQWRHKSIGIAVEDAHLMLVLQEKRNQVAANKSITANN